MVMAANMNLGGLKTVGNIGMVSRPMPQLPTASPTPPRTAAQDLNAARLPQQGAIGAVDLEGIQLPDLPQMQERAASQQLQASRDGVLADMSALAGQAARTSDINTLVQIKSEMQDDREKLGLINQMGANLANADAILASGQVKAAGRTAQLVDDLAGLAGQAGQTNDLGNLRQLVARGQQTVNDLQNANNATPSVLTNPLRNMRAEVLAARTGAEDDSKALQHEADDTVDVGQQTKIQSDIRQDRQKVASFDSMDKSLATADQILATGQLDNDPRAQQLEQDMAMVANQAAGTTDQGSLDRLAAKMGQDLNDLEAVRAGARPDQNQLAALRNVRPGVQGGIQAIRADEAMLANQAAGTTDQGQLINIQTDLYLDQQKEANMASMDQSLSQADQLVATGRVGTDAISQQTLQNLRQLAVQASGTTDAGTLAKIAAQMQQDINQVQTTAA